MRKFTVSIPETHYMNIIVEAESEEKAKEKADNEMAGGFVGDLEYSHTDNDMANWKVEEIK